MVSDDMFKLQMRSDVNKEDTCKNEVDKDVDKIVLCVPIRRVRARRMWCLDFLIEMDNQHTDAKHTYYLII